MLMTSKKELRASVRILKKQHTNDELKALSANVARKLLGLSCVKEAKTVLLYCSLPDEVYTMDIIHKLKGSGKRIVLPRVISERDMELREYTGDNDLTKGSFDIMEPCGKLFSDYTSIDVAVIPGMAFDTHGNRLGRGKGYYDRCLAKILDAEKNRTQGHIYKIGICFNFQLLDEIPHDEHDIPMDIVIS